VGGVAEIVIDGETGILVEPKDPLGLKKAIVKLLTNKDLRDKMGNKAKERAKALFGVDTMIEKTEKLYQELARLKGIR
jgi:glycosyltransferase involved in cell wall biosynthesis